MGAQGQTGYTAMFLDVQQIVSQVSSFVQVDLKVLVSYQFKSNRAVNSGGGVGVQPCGNTIYCCYGFNGCDCTNSTQVITLGVAEIVTQLPFSSVSSSTTATTTSRAPVKTSSAPQITTVIASPDNGSSGLKIGLGVGLGLGLPLSLAVVGVFILLLRKRREQPQEAQWQEPKQHPYSQGQYVHELGNQSVSELR